MAILLRDALKEMEDKDRSFSIRFQSYDGNRKKKGEKIFLPTCVLVGASHNKKFNDTVVVKPIDRHAHPYTVHMHLILEVNKSEVTI